MEISTLSIPEPTSSKLALEQKRIQLKESRAELKRKLSKISFEDQPFEYRKLRIEDLEVQVEEERFHKSGIDHEHQQRQMNDSGSRKAHRETNKRIVSLGSELWKENEQLRMQEELAAIEFPTKPQETAISVYEASKGAPFKGKIWCCISQSYFDKDNVRVAHIVPHALGPELVDYIFGSGSGSRLDSRRQRDPNNSLENPNHEPGSSAPAVHSDFMGGRETLNDYDGKEIKFKNDNRPASRFLYYHFIVTLLRNKKNRQPGWERFSTELPTGKPFATMGRYMRESMLLTLAKNAGDLNPAEETRLLGGDGGETFVEKEKLTEREETEVARRVFEAHEAEDEGDQDDDGTDS